MVSTFDKSMRCLLASSVDDGAGEDARAGMGNFEAEAFNFLRGGVVVFSRSSPDDALLGSSSS